MIKYAVCHGTTEMRVGGKLVSFSSDELIREFFSQDVIDYNDVGVYDTLDEAKAVFDAKSPLYTPSSFKNPCGIYFLRYSIVFIQTREYDEDEEIERIDEIECKTDGGFTVIEEEE